MKIPTPSSGGDRGGVNGDAVPLHGSGERCRDGCAGCRKCSQSWFIFRFMFRFG